MDTWMGWLVDASLRGAMAVGVVWLLEAALRRWSGPVVRSGWWLAVVVVFLLPWRMPLLPASVAAGGTWTVALAPVDPGAADFAAGPLPGTGLSLAGWVVPVLFAVWLTGALVRLTLVAVPTWQARHRWLHRRFTTDARLLAEFEDARERAGVWRPIGLVVGDDVPGPMVMGWWQPRLLVPSWMAEDMSRADRRRIFLHELAHIRHHDVLANWLAAACLMVHWFNPLAWVAARRWTACREQGADAAALRWSGDGAAAYGGTLGAVLRRTRTGPMLPAVAGMAESFRGWRERFSQLSGRPASSGVRVTGAAVGLLVLAAGAVAAPDTYVGGEGTKPAVTAMRPWLEGIDAGRYAESWDQAAPVFQKALTRAGWAKALEGVRQPLGTCDRRTLVSAFLQKDPPGAPAGEYVIAQFKTSFQNLKEAVETVTFQKQPDGTWKAAGYFIKPA